jgi:molybdopterin molybdotransferase
VLPLVPDTLDATRSALEEAFSACDVVVTSGGVSVGEMDFVKAAFESIGGTLELWRVAIKPGKPFVFGRRGGKFLFGLPGNPVSALVTFQLLVRPALRRMLGASDADASAFPAVLAEALSNPGDRRHFMRVSVDGKGAVRLAGAQASHRLGALPSTNGLVDVPARTNWPVGTPVTVMHFE